MTDVEHNNFMTLRELSRLGSRERNFAPKLHNLALVRTLISLRPSASSVFNSIGVFRIFREPSFGGRSLFGTWNLEPGTFNPLSALFSAVQPYSALFSVKIFWAVLFGINLCALRVQFPFAFIRVFRGPCLELGPFQLRPLPYSALFSAVQHYSALKKNIFYFWESIDLALNPSTLRSTATEDGSTRSVPAVL
jgi:hypothetical protein